MADQRGGEWGAGGISLQMVIIAAAAILQLLKHHLAAYVSRCRGSPGGAEIALVSER